jgi:hypothetical protein
VDGEDARIRDLVRWLAFFYFGADFDESAAYAKSRDRFLRNSVSAKKYRENFLSY